MHPTPFTCPVCGGAVPAKARACPDCGACEKSGWSGDAARDALDLPDDEFDYEKFVDDEFGGGRRKTGREWVWWVVAVVLLLAFALAYFRR